MRKLTKQEEKFCLEYIKAKRNGPKAAEAAGYEGDLTAIANELLADEAIKAEIKLYKKPKIIDPAAYWQCEADFGK